MSITVTNPSFDKVYTIQAWQDNNRTLKLVQGEGVAIPSDADENTSITADGIKAPRFQLRDKQRIFDLSSGNYDIHWAVNRPNGGGEDLLACNIVSGQATNGIIEIPITTSVTEFAGDAYGEIRVSSSSGVIKFFGVNACIAEGISDEAIAQSSRYSALWEALQNIANIEDGEIVHLDSSVIQGSHNAITGGAVYDGCIKCQSVEGSAVDGASNRYTIYFHKSSGNALGLVFFTDYNNYSNNAGHKVVQYRLSNRKGTLEYRIGTVADATSPNTYSWDRAWNDTWHSVGDDSLVKGIKNAIIDTSYHAHNTKLESYMGMSDYSSSDYTTSHIDDINLSNSRENYYDHPNTTTVSIPNNCSKIVFRDTITNTEWSESVSGTSHVVKNLIPNRMYTYNVYNSSGVLKSFGSCMSSDKVRMIDIGSNVAETDAYNIRDLGGWACDGGTMRYGVVYRGSELDTNITLSNSQKSIMRNMLGIKSEIDLRKDDECNGVTDTALGIGVDYSRFSISHSYQNAIHSYNDGDGIYASTKYMAALKQIAKSIKEHKPVYIHCQAGADRTGTLCMLIGAICGMSQSDLDRDYELSSFSYRYDSNTSSWDHNTRKRKTSDPSVTNVANWYNYMREANALTDGTGLRDKIVCRCLQYGVTIDEINTIREGLIDGTPAKLSSPYSQCTVTKNLSHISLDNPANTVAMYQPFESYVIADNMYKITSLAITMGGTDITNSCYSNGKITIQKVTDNIVINGASTHLDSILEDYYTIDEVDTELDALEEVINGKMKLAGLNDPFPPTLGQSFYTQDTIGIVTGYSALTGVSSIQSYSTDYIDNIVGITSNDVIGLQVDLENKVFTRLAGAVGKTAGEDFDAFPMYGGRRRCNVADNGTINAYFGDAGYTEDGSNGQVMVYQPAFWYKVVPLKLEKNTGGAGFHIRKANYYVSSAPKAGFKRHPLFYDASGNAVDYVLLSAYEGSMYDLSASAYVNDNLDAITYDTGDMLCSVAGKKPISGKLTGVGTKTALETMANNRGTGWHLDTYKAVAANQLLMMIELGTLNTQSAIGRGIVDHASGSVNESSLTGSTASLGNATGMASQTTSESAGTETVNTEDGKLAVTYRGVENPWGNIWKHIGGVNIWGDGTMGGGQAYLCSDFSYNESKHDGNYHPAGFRLANATGYTSAFGYGSEDFDWVLLASETTGNNALPVGDNFVVTTDLNQYKIMKIGGTWNSVLSAGGFAVDCNYSVNTGNRLTGGRLLYVPTAAV